jgi:hypothetical protein
VSRLEESLRGRLSLILLLLGAGTFFTLRLALGISGDPDISKLTVAEAGEFRAFVIWAITFACFVVAAVWGSIAAAAIVHEHGTKEGYRATVITAVVLTVIVAVLSRLFWSDTGVLAMIQRARGIEIRYFTLVGNALAAGSTSLILGACIALGTAPRTPAVVDLRRRMANSRLLLFSAAVLLVVAVAEISLVHQLPVAVEKARNVIGQPLVVQHVTRSITLAAGLMYTAALLILFVPLAVIHEKWVDDVWQKAAKEKRSEWLETTGLHRSIGSTTTQLIAIAAPWLAALGLPGL